MVTATPCNPCSSPHFKQRSAVSSILLRTRNEGGSFDCSVLNQDQGVNENSLHCQPIGYGTEAHRADHPRYKREEMVGEGMILAFFRIEVQYI